MATASSKSATIAELRRMFSNLDTTVIESVLVANNGQVDVTIDHLLTMSIDTENQNHNRLATSTTPLRQLPAVPNIYEDDPPPYPGHEATANNHSITTTALPEHSSNNSHLTENVHSQQDLQVRKWKTSYGQYRVCYIGDLPDDFLHVKFLSKSEIDQQSKMLSGDNGNTSRYIDDERLAMLFQNEDFINELRYDKEFITALHSEQPNRSNQQQQQQQTRSSYLSTKPLPLPTPPTVETPKTPKVRAKMLQNVLTQIEQGQTMKTPMVPEESVTQNEGYSYGKDNKERIPLPPAPYVSDYDPLRPESNEEFIARLKNMGKNSKEKFNQLARRFSTRKDSTTNTAKYSKQPTMPNTSERQRLTNEFDSEEDLISLNTNNPNRYLASV